MKKDIKKDFDINKELTEIRQIYNQKAAISHSKYSQEKDVRRIIYFKILEIIRFYQIHILHIINYFHNASNYDRLLKSIEMEHIKEDDKNQFAKSYETYVTFGFFVKLFCAIESSLRLIYKELQKPKTIINHVSLYNVMDCITKKTKIDPDYINLILLLATIRNSMHNYGMNIKDDKITYKGKKYEFKKAFIEKKYRSIDFTLNLIKNDIVNLFNDIFESEIISNINFIEDDLD